MGTRRLMIALMACAVLAPTGGHAFPTGPPYPNLAGANGECISRIPVSTNVCSTEQHVSNTTGAADVRLSLASLEGGTLPGDGYGYSAAWFEIPFTIESPVRSITLRATFHVEEASLSAVRGLEGLGPNGYMYLYAGLAGDCSQCLNESFVTLLDADNPGTLSDQTVEVVTTLAACCADPLSGGFIAHIELAALSGLGPVLDAGIGSFEATAVATLTETSLTTESPG